MSNQELFRGRPSPASTLNYAIVTPTHDVSTDQLSSPSSTRNQASSTSFKEQKRDYHLKKKYFTKNIQTAIDSSQEVHSGWIKARNTFKRWAKVWCQVKPNYLVMYTSQEAHNKHQFGVVLLSICQIIKRPTKKEGFCFKLINPFGYSVWAKSSTRAITFSQASLTLRVTDSSIGKLWLDAFQRCNLSANLNGYKPVIDESLGLCESVQSNQSDISDSDDGDLSTRQYDGILLERSNNNSNNNSISSFNNCPPQASTGSPFVNGNIGTILNAKGEQIITHLVGPSSLHDKFRPPIQSQKLDTSIKKQAETKSNDLRSSESQLKAKITDILERNSMDLNATKMVAKFAKYNWRTLQLEAVRYLGDESEELGCEGIQNETMQEGNKSFLWHIIKQLRPGMDLSKVTLPTFILEPRSFLEKLADYYYHCDILSDAVLIDDPSMRLVNIVKWYLSGFYKKPKGPKKPYNPLLGERFRCFWDHPKTNSRTFFVAEQVSHHPPISAFYVTNRKDGFTISCSLLSRSKYLGNSVSAILEGKAKLYLNQRNETYTLTMPYANCKGILLGTLSLELGGKVEIECINTGCRCELDFELSGFLGGSNSYNVLNGKIFKDNKVTHILEGHWDKKIIITDKMTNKKSTMWEVTDDVRSSRLKRHTVSFEDQGERESVKLWSKVTEALSAGDQTSATTEKTRLEDIQRQEARERTGTFVPEHFGYSPKNNEWFYRWLDSRPWNDRRDIMQFEENFKIKTLMLNSPSKTNTSTSGSPDIPILDPVIDLPVTQMSKLSDQVQLESRISSKQDPKNDYACKSNEVDKGPSDTFVSIKSKIEAENKLIKQAIQVVSEKNKELEEDLANLKRYRKVVAVVVSIIIAVILNVFFNYFT